MEKKKLCNYQIICHSLPLFVDKLDVRPVNRISDKSDSDEITQNWSVSFTTLSTAWSFMFTGGQICVKGHRTLCWPAEQMEAFSFPGCQGSLSKCGKDLSLHITSWLLNTHTHTFYQPKEGSIMLLRGTEPSKWIIINEKLSNKLVI